MGVDVNLCCGNDFAFVVETAKPLTPMILYVFSVKLDFAFTAGIDEMPKSQIEKRKRNVESTSRVSRREKRNVEICFLVREENENF